MKNNPESWSNELFEWMQTTSFESLSNDQKHKVLESMSMEDYTEMYNSTQMLNHQQLVSHRREQIKDELLNRFDTKYVPTSFQSSMLWKAASVILFALAGVLAYFNLKTSTRIDHQVVLHDTIYIEKEIQVSPSSTLTHLDTNQVPQSSTPQVPQTANRAHTQQKKRKPISLQVVSFPSQRQTEVNQIPSSTQMDIPVVSLNQLHSISNSNKRNSRKYDSLEQSLSFVSL